MQEHLPFLLKKSFRTCFIVLPLLAVSCSKEKIDLGSENNDLIYSKYILTNVAAVSDQTSPSILIMDNNHDLAFLGSMLEGQNILRGAAFNPIMEYQKLPIRVSSSLPGSQRRTIALPRLSTFRQTVQDIVRSAHLEGADVGSFLFYKRPFQDYNELANEFGYNLDTRSLFSSASSNIGSKLTTIEKKVGIIAGFELVNFTIDMELPTARELIDPVETEQLLAVRRSIPIYISSISYGQKGIFAIETNNKYEETTRVFEKLTQNLIKGTSETLTSSEIKLINESTIRVYLVGWSSGGSVVQIDGYHGFLNYIQGLGEFSADNPGYPISFRSRRLEDFSIFKTFNN